jgi:hypothetical protein
MSSAGVGPVADFSWPPIAFERLRKAGTGVNAQRAAAQTA